MPANVCLGPDHRNAKGVEPMTKHTRTEPHTGILLSYAAC